MEIELKLSILKENDIEKIWQHPWPPGVIDCSSKNIEKMAAIYYDTKQNILQKNRIAYRVRLEENKFVATVKGGGSAAGSLHQRHEWNITLDQWNEANTPDPGLFSQTEIGPTLLSLIAEDPLEEKLRTVFMRKKMILVLPKGKLELAIDTGMIKAGEKSTPIQELELELLDGHPSIVLETGAKLAQYYALLPESRSKYARGITLAGLSGIEKESKIRDNSINKNAPLSEGLKQQLMSGISKIEAAYVTICQEGISSPKVAHLKQLLHSVSDLIAVHRALIKKDAYVHIGEILHKSFDLWDQCSQVDISFTSQLLELWAVILSWEEALKDDTAENIKF